MREYNEYDIANHLIQTNSLEYNKVRNEINYWIGVTAIGRLAESMGEAVFSVSEKYNNIEEYEELGREEFIKTKQTVENEEFLDVCKRLTPKVNNFVRLLEG